MESTTQLDVKSIIDLINNRIETLDFGRNPKELYDPIRHIMELGGKRLRPLLSLLSYSIYTDDENLNEILDIAIGIELFHNFTLVHDDIMDNASIRRGKKTIHEKWNVNTAILSGDVMMIKVYDYLLQVDSQYLSDVIKTFNACAVEVCEGQQKDMNFESSEAVSESDYLDMITQKTAVLLGFSTELGGILAGSSDTDRELLKEFGTKIGIGFQLKDDLLDLYADQNIFGKKIGGDIVENKKTHLYIKAKELASEEQRKSLEYWYNKDSFVTDEKITAVKGLFDAIGVKKVTENLMNEYFLSAFRALGKLSITNAKKERLIEFSKQLIDRQK